MPYAKNGDINIYYEVEGEGTPLVLAHGGGDSMSMFRRTGYVEALKDVFKLILIDARGHGQSDKPHLLSAYGKMMAVQMAEDVISVLDDMEIEKANYFGYSMGAMTGFRVALNHSDRFVSFIFGGMSPYSFPEKAISGSKNNLEMLKAYLDGEEEAIANREKYLGRSLTDEEKNGLLSILKKTDAQAMIHVVSSLKDVIPLSDEDLTKITIPILVFAGELDSFYEGAKESTSHLPQSQFISLSELDHGSAFGNIDTVLPHIKEFLARVTN